MKKNDIYIRIISVEVSLDRPELLKNNTKKEIKRMQNAKNLVTVERERERERAVV